MALKKSPLNADPDPACFFTHRTCINMPSTAPERRQSPQERSGEGEGGGREERETRQSPGWLFLALLIVWDFFPASFATPPPLLSAHRQQNLWRMSCRIGIPRSQLQEANIRGRRNSQDWGTWAGKKGRNDVQKAEATPNQAEQLHRYENTKWEQWVGRKKGKKRFGALALWTACSASWWLFIWHPCKGQSVFPKVPYPNLCKKPQSHFAPSQHISKF